MKKPALTAVALAIGAGVVAGDALTPAAADDKFTTIGTGGQTVVYYVVGRSICKVVNRDQRKHNIKCAAPSIDGSVANPTAIKTGNSDRGIAQSGWQFHALKGTSKFADQEANDKLWAVFLVRPDPTVKPVVELCDAVVIPVKNPKIDRLVSETALCSQAAVSGGACVRIHKPVATFGVMATLVSSTNIEAETIYAPVKSVFRRIREF